MSRRVVLDTNVVLSALIFSTGRLVWIRTAWQQGRLLPLASRATLDEVSAPDPDDQKFLDLAVSGGASDLVTGDAGLLTVSPPPGLTVVTPEAFRGVMA